MLQIRGKPPVATRPGASSRLTRFGEIEVAVLTAWRPPPKMTPSRARARSAGRAPETRTSTRRLRACARAGVRGARGGGGLCRALSRSLGGGRVIEDGGPGECRPGKPRLRTLAPGSRALRGPSGLSRRGREACQWGTGREGREARTGSGGEGLALLRNCDPSRLTPSPRVSRASLAIPRAWVPRPPGGRRVVVPPEPG